MSDYDLFESEIEELYQKPEEPKVELTIDDAKQCLLSISLQHALFKSRYGANDRTVVRLEEIGKRLGSSISQAEDKK